MTAQIGFSEVDAGALLDEGDDGFAPSRVRMADDACVRHSVR